MDPGGEFDLEEFDREGVLIRMNLEEGEAFTQEDVLDHADDLDIVIRMIAQEGIIGGMTYRIDPELEIYNEEEG